MIRRRAGSAALRPWAALFVALTLLGAGCGKDDDRKAAATTTAPRVAGDITVLAAASMSDSFTEMGQAFEAANPGTHVKFSFDSSSTLAGQANAGAPADVFASADDANMKKATDGGSAEGAKPFTRNRMAVIVGKGNKKAIHSVKDFDRSDV